MTGYREKSYWLEALPEPIKPNHALEGTHSADVAIIGGGYTGLSAGYHLKKLNPALDVRLIESDVCGYGASGRNGGFSMTLFGLTKGITAFRFNDEVARAAQVYMEKAVDYLHDFIKGHDIPCDYEQSGYLLVGTSDAQVRRVEHDFKILEKWGLKGVERWDRKRLAAEFNTDFYKLGWFEPRCGILNPAKLVRGLKRVAESEGATLYEQSPVTGFSKERSGEFIVKTANGAVRAEHLVIATNAYSILFPELRALQKPAFTHIVLTEPLTDAQIESIGWGCRAGVEDARDLIHYYRLTADNRIAMGGGDVSLGYGADLDKDLNKKVFQHLESHITEVFPQLKGVGITHRWGGPVSITLDMVPVVGYLGQDQKALFSLGCIGHGVSMTTTNGRAIAELICGQQSERTELFFIGRRTVPWPPEPLTHGLVHAIRGFMKLEDRFIYK